MVFDELLKVSICLMFLCFYVVVVVVAAAAAAAAVVVVLDGFHDMDAFVGGLAEDHVEGGTIGELFAHIIGDQFFRLRNGDRHWYENTDVSGNKALLNKIKKGTEGTKGTKGTTMMDVIVRNSRLNPEDQVWDGHHTGERSAFLIPKTSMQSTRKKRGVEEHETTEL